MPALPLADRTRTGTIMALLALALVALTGAGACSDAVTQESDRRHGRVRIQFVAQAATGQHVNAATALDNVTVFYAPEENPNLVTQIGARIGPRFTTEQAGAAFDLRLVPGDYHFAAVVFSNNGNEMFRGSTEGAVRIPRGRFLVEIAAAPVGAVMVIEPATLDVRPGDTVALVIRNSGSQPLVWYCERVTGCDGCVEVGPCEGAVQPGQRIEITAMVSGQATGDVDITFVQSQLDISGAARETGQVTVRFTIR